MRARVTEYEAVYPRACVYASFCCEHARAQVKARKKCVPGFMYIKKNKVIRPKSRASALSEKSGKQTDEQTKTFKKTFELATKSLKNIFVTNQWTDRRMDRQTDRQMDRWTKKWLIEVYE